MTQSHQDDLYPQLVAMLELQTKRYHAHVAEYGRYRQYADLVCAEAFELIERAKQC